MSRLRGSVSAPLVLRHSAVQQLATRVVRLVDPMARTREMEVRGRLYESWCFLHPLPQGLVNAVDVPRLRPQLDGDSMKRKAILLTRVQLARQPCLDALHDFG